MIRLVLKNDAGDELHVCNLDEVERKCPCYVCAQVASHMKKVAALISPRSTDELDRLTGKRMGEPWTD